MHIKDEIALLTETNVDLRDRARRLLKLQRITQERVDALTLEYSIDRSSTTGQYLVGALSLIEQLKDERDACLAEVSCNLERIRELKNRLAAVRGINPKTLVHTDFVIDDSELIERIIRGEIGGVLL